MEQDTRFRFRKGDWISISAVVLLAVLLSCFLFLQSCNRTQGVVEIYLDGECVHTMPLGQDGTFTVAGDYRNTITVQDGKVFVSESDCPTHDCVRSGAISKKGQVLICLPNRLEVRINGQSDVDITIG